MLTAAKKADKLFSCAIFLIISIKSLKSKLEKASGVIPTKSAKNSYISSSTSSKFSIKRQTISVPYNSTLSFSSKFFSFAVSALALLDLAYHTHPESDP